MTADHNSPRQTRLSRVSALQPQTTLESHHVALGFETDRKGVLEAVHLLLSGGLLTTGLSVDLLRLLAGLFQLWTEKRP